MAEKQRILYSPIPISLTWSKRGSTQETRLLATLWVVILLCAVITITKEYFWRDPLIEVAGYQMYLITPIGMIISGLMVLWFGFWWGVIPAFASSILLGLYWDFPPVGLLLILGGKVAGLGVLAMVYRAVPIPFDMRSPTGLIFYLLVIFACQVADSWGIFLWSYFLEIGTIALDHDGLAEGFNPANPFAVWQGWWIFGTLTRYAISVPLLFWLSPKVGALKSRLGLARQWERPSKLWVALTLGLMLLFLAAFLIMSGFLQNVRLDATLQDVQDEEVLESINLAVRSLNVMPWIYFSIFASLGFLGYQIWARWTETLERQVMKQTETITASLEEKKVLLKEIHHRVKNNMATISSLLSMQSRQIQDKQAAQLIDNARDRVKSMAIIHERLYQTDDLSSIDFGEYINSLATQLYRSYSVDPDSIQMKINVGEVRLTVDLAIPCGLILNELIANALQHGFPNNRKGEIRIELLPGQIPKAEGEIGTYLLIVADNGVGLPDELDVHNTDSLGLQLVSTLVNQIDGLLEVTKKGETQFRISFAI